MNEPPWPNILWEATASWQKKSLSKVPLVPFHIWFCRENPTFSVSNASARCLRTTSGLLVPGHLAHLAVCVLLSWRSLILEYSFLLCLSFCIFNKRPLTMKIWHLVTGSALGCEHKIKISPNCFLVLFINSYHQGIALRGASAFECSIEWYCTDISNSEW